MGSRTTKPKERERIVLLSGGVGGARLARGFAATTVDLTVIVNTGDDEEIYGLHISPDLDTVAYTLAGIEGPAGWGLDGDSFIVMDALAAMGVDTSFRLGDRDLANCLARTLALSAGTTLSEFTGAMTKRLGVEARLLPATNHRLRTMIHTDADEWITFQDYFVMRSHGERVTAIAFDGAEGAVPTPGVMEAISAADRVVIGPSNPPLSIWPILAVPGMRQALASKHVTAVSPLIGAKAIKGPAAEVLESLGIGAGSTAIAAAYEGIIDTLVVDTTDAADAVDGVEIRATDTHISSAEAATRLALWL